MTIQATGGVPGSSGILVADALNGSPAPLTLLFILPFEASGAPQLAFRVPGGLSGLTLRVQLLTGDADGDLAVSNKAEMVFS